MASIEKRRKNILKQSVLKCHTVNEGGAHKQGPNLQWTIWKNNRFSRRLFLFASK